MKAMMKITVSIGWVAAAASMSLAAPKDITTRVNPDGSNNIEARYLVHVGFSAYNAGLTSAVSVNSRGLVEIHNSGGNSNNWGVINDNLLTYAQQTAAANTFGGSNPHYGGYQFNLPVKNLSAVKFWNRSYADGGTFSATPDLQYLDGPEPFGTWQPLTDVTWDVPYDTTFVANAVRPYTITVNHSPAVVWGVRIIGNGNPAGNVASSPSGWAAFNEITVYGELDLGSIDLSKNKSIGATAIANAEQTAGQNVLLNDGNITTRSQTYGGNTAEDYYGILWGSAQNRVAALGVCFQSFTDGGLFDDCQDPIRIECTTSTVTAWHPVTGLNKYRYPYIWQRLTYLASTGPQLGFLFTFDEVSDLTGLRIIGDPHGFAGDRTGFLGAYEIEVFGKPVPMEGVDFDHDGDLDLDDAVQFGNCVSGPAIPQTVTICKPADLDKDGDVDQADFAIFQNCFSGAGIHWNPLCGTTP